MTKQLRPFVCTLAISSVLVATNLQAQTAPPKSPWAFTASLTLKETYDSNVFLQDTSALADRHSMVTSVTPSIGLSFQQTAAFKAALSYAPEVVRYHSYSSENYEAHRASLNLTGKSGDTAWEFLNSLIWIDGSDQGPIFDVANGGDIPAIGGIPLRDRRDAIIFRNTVKVTQTIGKWFLRPIFTAYVHDFGTEQRVRTGPYAGYENYVDRYELNGGADIGYEIRSKTWLVAGYRFGHQEQGKLLGVDSLYCNNYHRILLGVEGTPANWLKLNVLAGPEFRVFEDSPVGLDRNEQLWFINASASWLPTKKDTITLTLSRYEQPAFSSHSVYEDIVYDLSWKHQCTSKFTAAVGMKVYGGDWQAPVNREDWIYSPSVSIGYAFNKYFSADVAWSYDTVSSEVPNTDGREFTRNLVSISLKASY